MANIKLNPDISVKMLDHARASYPEECCGFLFGFEDKEGNREISEIMIVNNVKEENRKRRFEIDPLDYIKAEQMADKLDLRLLSIYHSHPDHPAKPSEHDRVQAVPYFSYIIMSVSASDIENTTSWQLNDQEEFDEERLILQ